MLSLLWIVVIMLAYIGLLLYHRLNRRLEQLEQGVDNLEDDESKTAD